MIIVKTFINVNTDHRFMPYQDGDPVVLGPTLYFDGISDDLFMKGEDAILEKAFFVGNRMGPDAGDKHWPSNVRSMSVGDLVEIEGFGIWAVEPFGFKYIHR